MDTDIIEKIFSILSKQNPYPRTELNYTNHYTLMVAVMLSAQSTDIGVNKVTNSLFKKISTPEDMIKLGLTNLIQNIRTIGLFNTKARNIIATSQILIDQYHSQVPED